MDKKGYTVIPDVLTESECDHHVASYRQWLGTFPKGTWPQPSKSLIYHYHIAHMEPSWNIRLKTYPVFAKIWGTKKLLTSLGAVIIGPPPEEGDVEFWSPELAWLHCDQPVYREGVHTYQGAVYLEHCDEDDWTFEVVEGSDKLFQEFNNKYQTLRCQRLSSEDLGCHLDQGCVRKRVPCPKGAMIFWDSRLIHIHANARPIKGRVNPGRWRYGLIVCVTPAAWATPADLELKARVYNNLETTGHWASTHIHVFPTKLNKGSPEDLNPLTELPDIAKTELAKRLPYDDDDQDDKDPTYTPKLNLEK